MKDKIDNLENKIFQQTFQEYILKLLSSVCNRHINNSTEVVKQHQLENLEEFVNKNVELNNLSELLSSVFYDFCRDLQNETSYFCTFDLVKKACDSIRDKIETVNYCKWNRIFNKNYKNVYHKLVKRSLDPTYKRTSDDSNRDFKIIFQKIQRTVNIWAHHVPYDDFDVDKPYNEPPQVQIIRFDMTGDVIITGGSEGIIKLWDVHTCKSIMTLKKHSGAISSLDVHPTNSFIVSCCEGGEIWLWEISYNFYRPHRMLKSTYKFLWVRFLVNGQKQYLEYNNMNCNENSDHGFNNNINNRDNNYNNENNNSKNNNNKENKDKYYGRMDYQDRDNWNKCLESTLIVSLDANSILRVYRMTELLGSSSGDNIYTEVTPLYYVDLFNHNITAYDLSKCSFNGTFITAIGIEPLDAQDLDNVDFEEINNTLSYIKNTTFHKININIKGKYKDLIGKSGFALLMIPLIDPNETHKNSENNTENNYTNDDNKNVDYEHYGNNNNNYNNINTIHINTNNNERYNNNSEYGKENESGCSKEGTDYYSEEGKGDEINKVYCGSGDITYRMDYENDNDNNINNRDNNYNNENNNNKYDNYSNITSTNINSNEYKYPRNYYMGKENSMQIVNQGNGKNNGFPNIYTNVSYNKYGNWYDNEYYNGHDDEYKNGCFNGYCSCDCSRNSTSTCIGICVYCGKKKYSENKKNLLNITHYEGNENVELPTSPKSMFVWVSQNSSEIEKFFVDCLPEFTFYEPSLFDSYTPGVPTMHYGKFSSSIILPACLGTGGGNSSDSVDFDKLFLNFVKDAHIQSPDVCFANTSANHISASDDGMVFLWSYQGEGFKSVQLITKTMERWRSTTTGFKGDGNKTTDNINRTDKINNKSEGYRNNLKNTSLPNSNYDILIEREPSSLKSSQRNKTSPLGSNYRSIYNKDNTNKDNINNNNKEDSKNKDSNTSSNAIYMVVEISWSTNDKYVCVADSIVTKHNYRKAITQARTICSGLSFFSNDGKRISDFLHDTLSYHVSSASFNPVCEEVCLVACYDGLIVIVDVVFGSILNKMNFGPTSIWMDVRWHPMGQKFVACQKYGSFSMFSSDPKELSEKTPNYQSTYLDYYSNSLSYCNSAYSGPEANNVKLKRYYSSFSNAPITLNGDSTYEKVNKSLNGGPVVFLDEHKNNVIVHTSGGVKRCRLVSYMAINNEYGKNNMDNNYNNSTRNDKINKSNNNNTNNINNNEESNDNNKNNKKEKENNEVYFGTDYITHSLYLAMCKINGFREYFEGHYCEDENGDGIKIIKQYIRLMDIVNDNNRNIDNEQYKHDYSMNFNENTNSKYDYYSNITSSNINSSIRRYNENGINMVDRINSMNKVNGMGYKFVDQKNREDKLQEISEYRCYLGECTLCENYLTLNEQYAKYISVKDSFVQLKTLTDKNGLILRSLPPSARPQDLLDSLDSEQTVTPVRRMDPSSYLNTCSSRSNRMIVSSSSEEPLVGVGLVLPTNMFSDVNILDNNVTFDSNSECGSVHQYGRRRLLSDSYAYDLRNRVEDLDNENDINQIDIEEREEMDEEEEYDDEFELGNEEDNDIDEEDEDSEEETDEDDELMIENYKRRSSRLANANNLMNSKNEYKQEETDRRSSRRLRELYKNNNIKGKNNIDKRNKLDMRFKINKENNIDRIVRGDERKINNKTTDNINRTDKINNINGTVKLDMRFKINKINKENNIDRKEGTNKTERILRSINKEINVKREEEKVDIYSFRSKRGYESFTNERLIESARNLSMSMGGLIVKYKKSNIDDTDYMSRTCVFCGMGDYGNYRKLTRNQTQKFSNTIFSRGDTFNPVCKLFENVMVGPINIPNKYHSELYEYTTLFKRIEGTCEIYSHASCLMVSGVKIDTGNKLVNLLEILVKSSFEDCKFCESKFATVCCVKCNSWFHYPCSIAQYIGFRKEVKGIEILNQYDPVVCEKFICAGCGVIYEKKYLTSNCYLKPESRKWLMNEYDEFENNFNIQMGDCLVLTNESMYERINIHVRWITQKEYPIVVKVVDINYVFNEDSSLVCCLLVESMFGEFEKLCVFVTPKTRLVLLRDFLASICLLSKIEEGSKVRCKIEGNVYETKVRTIRIDLSLKDDELMINSKEDTKEGYNLKYLKKVVKYLYNIGHNSINVLVDNRTQWVSTWDLECDGDLLTEIKSHSFLESDKQKLLDILGEKKMELFYTVQEFKPGTTTQEWISEYWKSITRPIGLKEINEKLFNVYYRSPYGVIGDLKLLISNCRKFNSVKSIYSVTASHLNSSLDKFKEELDSEEEWNVIIHLVWPKVKETLKYCIKNKEKYKEKPKVKINVDDEEVCLDNDTSKSFKRKSEIIEKVEKLRKPKRRSSRLINKVDKPEKIEKEFKIRKNSRYSFR